MRHDELAAGFHRDFQDHIVLWIPEYRSPEEVDLPVVTDGAEVVQHGIDVFVAQCRDGSGAFRRRFVL